MGLEPAGRSEEEPEGGERREDGGRREESPRPSGEADTERPACQAGARGVITGLSGEGVRSGVLAWYGEKMVEARGGRQ